MKISLRRKPGRPFFAFAWRASVLITLLLALANIGFLMAQGLGIDTSQLLRNVVGGSDYLFQTNFFIYLPESMIIPAFGIAFLVLIGLSLGHFFTFGPKDMSITEQDVGIPWWNMFERVIHWIIAVVFMILLISGLLITFGRFVGGGGASLFLRQIHDYAGFLFIPALVITIVMWLKEAIPRMYDWKWFLYMGGYLGYKGHLKSGKFNAGQKQWYWIMAVSGILLSLTGLALFFQYGQMSEMRIYVVIYFFAAMLMIIMFLAHLYMTTLGTKGALMGMFHGKLSKKAAQAYHSESSLTSKQ